MATNDDNDQDTTELVLHNYNTFHSVQQQITLRISASQ